ncbi:hypothetical protein [Oscillatoria salina]|uniref:hypothetical protein n=1 Tax=Oscillatoria salina TaxID=331517 RepID=UPI0013B983F2|nr:hypothetical protein [Oscillatoria salina]MBZ8180256.1 hypothetical protein [Oscillatoria salina IIICB1]NET89598.1 hypothetical protein [Kamptonema sp. SIO1D9]
MSETPTRKPEKTVYPDPEIMAYMEHQAKLFDLQRAELLNKYRGMYVVFEDGEVLDFDRDEVALVIRTYEKMGRRPMFVQKVLPQEPQPVVRTPYRPMET